jgi:hypothetical protein
MSKKRTRVKDVANNGTGAKKRRVPANPFQTAFPPSVPPSPTWSSSDSTYSTATGSRAGRVSFFAGGNSMGGGNKDNNNEGRKHSRKRQQYEDNEDTNENDNEDEYDEDMEERYNDQNSNPITSNNEEAPLPPPGSEFYPVDIDRIHLNGSNGIGDLDYKQKMGDNQGPLQCFGCTHVGENSPAIQNTKLQILIRMLPDCTTTDLDQHCVNIAKYYRSEIRDPANALLEPGEDPLPDWTPSTIKSHILYHGNDPEMVVEAMMHSIKNITLILLKTQMLERKIHTSPPSDPSNPFSSTSGRFRPRPPTYNDQDDNCDQIPSIGGGGGAGNGENNAIYRVHKDNLKAVKDLVDSYIKLGKSNPSRMRPNSQRSHQLMTQQSNKATFLDASKKKLKKTGSINSYVVPNTLRFTATSTTSSLSPNSNPNNATPLSTTRVTVTTSQQPQQQQQQSSPFLDEDDQEAYRVGLGDNNDGNNKNNEGINSFDTTTTTTTVSGNGKSKKHVLGLNFQAIGKIVH